MIGYYTSVLILCWLALATMCILAHENGRICRRGKLVDSINSAH